MSNRTGIIILMIILATGTYWFLSRSKDRPTEVQEPTEVAETIEKAQGAQENAPDESAEKIVTPDSNPAVLQENYRQAVEAFNACFESKNGDPNEKPSVEAWLNLFHGEFGRDPAWQSEEWTNTHITLPNGEKRRIHLEYETNASGELVRKLKYAGVDKEDLPVPIELPPEQSTNPSDTFVASLEKEGEVNVREKSMRYHYSDDTEALALQRNETFSELDLSHAGKSFRCWNLDQPGGQCECQ